MMSALIYCYAECHCTERDYAECRVDFIVMLNVNMLSAVMLNVLVPGLSRIRLLRTYQVYQVTESNPNGPMT